MRRYSQVFPVPDGDTGNNLVATLRNSIHSLGAVPAPSLSTVTKTSALQAALSSMGNSGKQPASCCGSPTLLLVTLV